MSFWSDLTGASARKDTQQAYDASTGMLKQGYDTARGDITGGRDRANAMLQPFLDSAGKSTKLRDDMLGINGVDAQKAAYAAYQNDPGWQAELDAGVGALDRSATARGGLYSGDAMKGVAKFGQQFQRQSFNDRINHLSGAAGQGAQTAGAAAGMEYDAGSKLGDLSFGFGQQNASNRINLGNAKAASRGTLPNLLMGAVGTGFSGMNAMANWKKAYG